LGNFILREWFDAQVLWYHDMNQLCQKLKQLDKYNMNDFILDLQQESQRQISEKWNETFCEFGGQKKTR